MTSPPAPRWLRRLLLVLAVALGLFRILADRDLQGGDSISYLDIASAWARGDWGAALNSFWSPLYSWLLAVMLAVLRPAPEWEFTAVTAMSFAVYLFLLTCFLFFWRAVENWKNSAGDAQAAGFSPAAWSVLGCALFLWATLDLTRLTRSPADMLLAASLYLACGLLARMRSGDLRPATLTLLGVALGLGYLAKAPILPLAPIFLAAALWMTRSPRRLLPVLAGMLVFVLPWAAAISRHKQRPTLGDTALLNYAWHVNGAPMFYWQGEPAGTGTPEHAPRKLSSSPALYEFAQPLAGSYPIWYDPSYWNEGLHPHFDLGQQWDALAKTVPLYQFVLRSRPDLALIPLVLLLHFALATRGAPLALDRRVCPWFVFAPALAGLAMYSLVYVERRHIAVFVVLFWAAIFSALRFPDSGRTGRLATTLAALTLAATLVLLLLGAAKDWRYIRERPERVHWRVAQELERRGARPGDRLLTIGGGLWSAPLARVARVRIAADIPATDSAAFWSSDQAKQAALLDRVAQLGIRLVVADCTNCSPPPACTRFPNTSVLAAADQRDFYVCDLSSFPGRR